MSKWMIANKKADFNGLSAKFGIRDVTARLIANRLITKRENEALECSDAAVDAYLNGGIEALHDPKLMADMEKGAEVMLERIKAGAKIRVIGDYDVDGICSSFILVSTSFFDFSTSSSIRAGCMRPSTISFSKAILAISRRTGSKLERITASGVSSIIRSTPVSVSMARMFLPSRPIILPFISSLGRGTTEIVASATYSAARR